MSRNMREYQAQVYINCTAGHTWPDRQHRWSKIAKVITHGYTECTGAGHTWLQTVCTVGHMWLHTGCSWSHIVHTECSGHMWLHIDYTAGHTWLHCVNCVLPTCVWWHLLGHPLGDGHIEQTWGSWFIGTLAAAINCLSHVSSLVIQAFWAIGELSFVSKLLTAKGRLSRHVAPASVSHKGIKGRSTILFNENF